MRPQNLLLFVSSSVLILLQTCVAICTPACGVIRNISYPFRLKHDPKHCGSPVYELACENDVAFLYLRSHKHYVKEINYLNSTIWLADASIKKHDVCSFPNYSLYNFSDPYSFYRTRSTSLFGPLQEEEEEVCWPVNLMRCPHPLKNSSLFTEVTPCHTSHPGFRYIKVGHMKASGLPQSCRIDAIVLTSWDFKNVSLSEIHNSLLYGFRLTYFHMNLITTVGTLGAYVYGFLLVLLALSVAGVVCSAVSPPLSTILGCTAVLLLSAFLGLILFSIIRIPPAQTISLYVLLLPLLIPLFIVFIILVIRFIIFLFALCFLIYKFRTRHLSVYDAIERFLQGDNKLMPIRYSYYEIKKMTRGFQDKLGEGGFGSVYKGKLRSGSDVAVKLLRKSGAHGKDFMNEIATIGRIHHVNIVKLVGYCVQGSTHALVFDFMPNGSLEKYLFNRENKGSLDLDTKFEIAIGVARGIQYLHRGCDVQILHFDIKPHNILLADKFIPKISDFGLAKLCSTDKTAVTMTAARGTIGYVAPELISRSIGAVSYKADVYSFGMLLVDMVNLKRDLIGNNGKSEKYFPYWIYDCLDQGKDIEIEIDDENDNDRMRRLGRKMIIVALWCIQMNPDDRPSMDKVLEMLEGDVEDLQIPNHPSESSHIAGNADDTGSGITRSIDSIPLLIHDGGSSYFEITVEE